MRYVEFLDISVPNAGALGVIEFDPFLAAVASLKTVKGLPLVSHWIDPSPAMSIVEDGAFFLRDAANEGIMRSPTDTTSTLQKTNAINGQPTFTADGDISHLLQGSSPNVNETEWSILSVQRLELPTGSGITRYGIVDIGDGGLSGNIFPGLEVTYNSSSPAQLCVREGGTSERRVVRNMDGLFNTPVLVASTFSIEQGVAVFKNNMETLARNEEDTRPLTMPTFTYLANRSGANKAMGDFGMTLILRADITKPEYRGAANIILNGLMSRYRIG